jgi:hypothetical protein
LRRAAEEAASIGRAGRNRFHVIQGHE